MVIVVFIIQICITYNLDDIFGVCPRLPRDTRYTCSYQSVHQPCNPISPPPWDIIYYYSFIYIYTSRSFDATKTQLKIGEYFLFKNFLTVILCIIFVTKTMRMFTKVSCVTNVWKKWVLFFYKIKMKVAIALIFVINRFITLFFSFFKIFKSITNQSCLFLITYNRLNVYVFNF